MPTGIGTALVIGSLASAGAGVAGAKMASNSANKAAKTQTAAADRSAALMQQAYQQQQQLQAPYLQAGRNAIGNLSSLMNPGQPYTPQMQAQNQQAMQLGPQFTGQQPPGSAVPRQGPPTRMGAPPMLGGGPPPMAGGGPMASAMAPQGDMVLMSSPDGRQTQRVPRAMAQQFLAQGARVIG